MAVKTQTKKRVLSGSSKLSVARLSKLSAPYNPRSDMPAQAFKALRRSISEIGVGSPVTLNRRTVSKGWPKGAKPIIVGGHQRVKAAAAEGLKEFDVFWVDLDRNDEELMNLGLNQITGRFDDDQLAKMLREIQDRGADASLAGFSDPDLKRLMQQISQGKRDPDSQPDRVQKRVVAGDVWQLGDHRLLVGDATVPTELKRLWGDLEPPVLCVTDPPYGVEYDASWRQEAFDPDHKQDYRTGKVKNDDKADWSEVWKACGCDVIYAWCAAGDLLITSGASLQASGYDLRASIIWKKANFPISRGHYTFTHEPCWYAVRSGGKAHWIGDKAQATVWEASLDKNVPGGHSTQKPVAIFLKAIANHDGDVFEPFAGSGTCLIACEQLGRRCFAIEIDEHYCNVIIARWEEFTDRKAVRLKRLKKSKPKPKAKKS